VPVPTGVSLKSGEKKIIIIVIVARK
jgi:hypothetical protein